MPKHAAPYTGADEAAVLRSQPSVASLARGLRRIAAEPLAGPFEAIDRMTIEEAADMLVTLVDQRDAARDIAARLEAENARLVEGGA